LQTDVEIYRAKEMAMSRTCFENRRTFAWDCGRPNWK